LPHIGAETRLSSDIPDRPFNYSTLLQDISSRSLDAVIASVAEVDAKVRAIMQIKPLDYPIVDTIRSMKKPRYSVDTYPFYNLLLKGYQREEVLRMYEYARNGIFEILALDMGLGKTATYAEFICKRIGERDGVHLIVGPKSMLHTSSQEVLKF